MSPTLLVVPPSEARMMRIARTLVTMILRMKIVKMDMGIRMMIMMTNLSDRPLPISVNRLGEILIPRLCVLSTCSSIK
jgi:hypothetical protein